MPVPLQSDVQHLTLKFLAKIREKFFFGSAVEQNCLTIPLPPGHDRVSVPTYNDFYVESVPDGARMEQFQTLKTQEITISTGLVGGQFILNAAAMRNTREDDMALAQRAILGEFKKKRARDLLSLAPLWTSTPIGGPTVTLTYGHLLAAAAQLQTNAARKAREDSKLTIVAHGRALYPVLRNMMGVQTGGGFGGTIPAGLSQDLIEGNRRLDRVRPVLSVMGANVFAENYIVIDSANSMNGMAFFEEGIIYVPAEDIEERVHDRIVGFYGTVVDIWARYGYGLGPYQQDGLLVQGQAAMPTS